MNENHRILIIDDMESIHEDFKKILTPEMRQSKNNLDELHSAMFGKTNKVYLPPYELAFATQGEEGVNIVSGSLRDMRPFALAFVDVQMPPGMDGIDTIEKIWKLDKEIQIVICTAYANYTWEDIQKRFGENDRIFILKKPFEDIEILNLASNLTQKWGLNKVIKNILQHEKKPVISGVQKLNPAKLEDSLKRMNDSVNKLKQLNTKLNDQQKKELL